MDIETINTTANLVGSLIGMAGILGLMWICANFDKFLTDWLGL